MDIKYAKLLRRAYKKLGINNGDRHISELFKSIYSHQANDYILVKVGNHKAPVDYQLYPIVRKMLSMGFRPSGWNFNEHPTNVEGGMPTFIAFLINKHNKTMNTQNRLKRLLENTFNNDTNIEIEKLADNVTVTFDSKYLPSVMRLLNVRKSRAQVLPGMITISKMFNINDKDLEKIADDIPFTDIENPWEE